MANCFLNRIVIASVREKTGRIVNFHRHATVVTGDNDTGKSSLLKSILYTLGAEPPMHPVWKDANVHTLLYCTIGSSQYRILRSGKTFSVFDEKGVVISCTDSVSNGLAPVIAKMFGFGVKLQNQNRKFVTPPPAFLFLPFYFDQDRSWTDTWNSFDRLGQMRDWKRDIVEYHVGIKPNEYYDLKGQQAELMKVREALETELKALKHVRDEIREQIHTTSFTIDLAAFEKEVASLLIECEKLQKTADRMRDRLVSFHNERIELEAQMQIVTGSLSELGKDYKFLQQHADHVDCPTCGASYHKDFADVFGIAVDEDRCEDLLLRLKQRHVEILRQLEKSSDDHIRKEEEIASIRTLLAERKEQVQLKDLIENEGKKQVQIVLREKVDALNLKLIEKVDDLEKIKKKLAQLTSKERTANINAEFRRLLRSFVISLGVPAVPVSDKKTVCDRITEQGSDLPRALLAYGFSILHVMRTHSSSVFCPIIMDSPIQQEQDKENHHRILEFIRDKRPEGSQLILSVVDDRGVDFGGDVLRLSDKRQLMSQENYEEAWAEISPLFESTLFSPDN